MMYSNQFVVAVKSNGRILRERKDEVYVPFGSEYSVLLKNLSSRRAQARVSIDNVDVGDGIAFIVEANDEIELERFIKNGNLSQGNRFKFIERTGKIEQHRGIKLDDGLIRVEFWFEKEKPKTITTTTHHHNVYHDHYWPKWPYYYNPPTWLGSNGLIGSGSSGGLKFSGGSHGSSAGSFGAVSGGLTSDSIPMNAVNSFCAQSTPTMDFADLNDAGITVPGSVSDQKFHFGATLDLEAQSQVLVLKMLGAVGKAPVKRAVTVKSKITCQTCGKRNASNVDFCGRCGTALKVA